MSSRLLVGVGEVDITPPVGTALSGSLRPRISTGVQDPLLARAIVLESEGVKLCYVLLDICSLPRVYGDNAIALASQQSGIPATNIIWATSHTHTGPYTSDQLGDRADQVNYEWLEKLPGKFADAVMLANQALQPARMSRERAFCYDVQHNRRLRFKDGREINRWLLNRGEEEIQSLGTAAAIDPEVGIICFDDENGVPIAVLWHFALHTNKNFGLRFSADFPAVVASRLLERYGRQVMSIFMPGACGDINPSGTSYREIGDRLAEVIIARLEQRQPVEGALRLGAVKEEMTVPWRDPDGQSDERVVDSQWDAESQENFRIDLEMMKKQTERYDKTIMQAWRIGNIGFASLPGEAFVSLGLEIKERSPFPWTFPVELCGDCLGYLVTKQAWEGGGYESLVSKYARPSVEAVAAMVDKAVELLDKLWQEQ